MSIKRKVKQLQNDFASTTVQELTYRIWDTFLTKSGNKKNSYPEGWMSDEQVLSAFGNRFSSKADLCRHLKERTRPVFFFPNNVRKEYQSLLDRIIGNGRSEQEIEDIMNHRFSFLGQTFCFGETINWHVSTLPNMVWPLIHWSDLDITGAAGYGDIKPVWELNRLQHFPILGRVYWRTGDRRYVCEFMSQMNSWIKSNPAEIGINWQSNLEIALRSISIIWALQFFICDIDEQSLFDIIRLLIHSGRHMNKHIAYSDYCMHNNHLIGDAAGLAFVAIYLPELVEAAHWREKSLGFLYEEIEEQVFPDGVNVEQATGYHRFVFYLFLLPILMEKLNGGRIPESAWSRLEKMVEYVHWMIKPNGLLPMIGDADDGQVLVLSDSSLSDYKSMLATGAVLFSRPDFKFSAGCISEEVLWLFGPEGISRWEDIPETVLSTGFYSKAFVKGGYYIMKSGWDDKAIVTVFKNGPHSAHHAHADQLHVELTAFGKDLLIDPGTYIYNGNLPWRNYFRGTFAHNTVVVDKESQSIPHRSFRWVDIAKAEKVKTYFGQKVQWVYGGHFGYKRYKDPVTHHRGVLKVFGDYLIIIDDIAAKETHDYEMLFHFSEGSASVDCNTLECKVLRDDGVGLMIKHLTAMDVQPEIAEGQKDSEIQGWISYKYGEKMPAPVLIYHTTRVGPWKDAVLLKPFQGSTSLPEVLVKKYDDGLTLSLKQDEQVDTIVYGGNLCHNVSVFGDSQIVFSRCIQGNLTYIFASNGTQVKVKDSFSLVGKWNFIEVAVDESNRRITTTGDISDIIVEPQGLWEVVIEQSHI